MRSLPSPQVKVKDIRAAIAPDQIPAGATVQTVISSIAVQPVVAAAPDQKIVLEPAFQMIAARQTCQNHLVPKAVQSARFRF